jgi:hypothetical protein
VLDLRPRGVGQFHRLEHDKNIAEPNTGTARKHSCSLNRGLPLSMQSGDMRQPASRIPAAVGFRPIGQLAPTSAVHEPMVTSQGGAKLRADAHLRLVRCRPRTAG